MTENKIQSGFIEVPGGNVWFKSFGLPSEKPAVLAVHGGPGYPHPDLYPLRQLYRESGIPVVLYDQLGAGFSDKPEDNSLWNIERFVEELGLVHTFLQEKFSINGVHLFGHSWGGTLVNEYIAAKQPDGIKSLILASPYLSAGLFQDDLKMYLDSIRPGLSQNLPLPGTPEYEEIEQQYFSRHIYRPDELPLAMRLTDRMVGKNVYDAMIGNSEFDMTGILGTYEGMHHLKSLFIPTLFTCGRYDEISPRSVSEFSKLAQNSEMIIFENSAHMPHFEESKVYLKAITNFINRSS